MFAVKKTFKLHFVSPSFLVLMSALLCAQFVFAQQPTDEAAVSPGAGNAEADEEAGKSRRIERLGDVSTDEWEMDLSLPTAPAAAPVQEEANSLPDAAQDQQLQQLLSGLATDPDSSEINEQLDTLLSNILALARGLIDSGSTEEAAKLLAVIKPIDPGLPGLKTAQRRLQALKDTQKLLAKAEKALAADQLIEPEKGSALYYFNQTLRVKPDSSAAQQGLARIQEALIERANEAAQELDFEMSAKWLNQASAVGKDQTMVDDAWQQLTAFQSMHADDLESKALEAMNAGDFNTAEFNIIDLIALGGQEERVKSLREQLEEARFYGGFEPGQVISDSFLNFAGKAPDIVVIAAGSFLMGSSGQSGGAYNNEQPRHRVTIERGFGFGVTEVTVAQFGLFVERSGYVTGADSTGESTVYDETAGRLIKRKKTNWQNDYRGKKGKPEDPVLHVNLHDARAYVQWLAAETGKRYRLPTEAEYEYVARGAVGGTFWWGEGSPSKPVENLTGQRDRSPSKRSWTTPFKRYGDGYWGPSPAGSLRDSVLVHPMGVYDIAGNVSEWTEDCWHPNYMKAPVDGSAWVNRGCERTVVRGGYWASAPDQARAAFRISARPETLGPVVGIRIARDLQGGTNN